MPSLRICQITPHLESGGVETRIARTLSKMDRDRFSLSWVGLKGDLGSPLVQRAGADVEVIAAGRKNKKGIDTEVIFKLARILRRLRPQLVHVHNWSTSLYGILGARLARVPRVLYGVGGREGPQGASPKQRAVMRTLAPHLDGFTTVCDFLAQEMAQEWNVGRDRVSVIRTGIETERFALAKAERARARAEARAQLNISEDAVVFGTVTVLRPVKRLDDLIDAAGLALASSPKLRLVLVGNIFLHNGFERLRARARAAGLGEERLILPGRIEAPERVLPAFDAYVNCSIFEGTSNAIMEAMSASLPIVATRVGGTPELVEDGGCARLVPPQDPQTLAKALIELSSSAQQRERWGERSLALVRERNSVPQMVQTTEELYEATCRRPRPGAISRGLQTGAGALSGLTGLTGLTGLLKR